LLCCRKQPNDAKKWLVIVTEQSMFEKGSARLFKKGLKDV
jgi:hypothetical protein